MCFLNFFLQKNHNLLTWHIYYFNNKYFHNTAIIFLCAILSQKILIEYAEKGN